ncbi:hypothetical protein C0993_003000 [Termitomyces sp. T159_Od127]|nr:hypothetical protein C0993_003000 [Termitomyces sp. T159_Od127]
MIGEALVASAAADGSVQIAKLTQSYNNETDLGPPELLLTFEASEKIVQPDKTGLTALSLVEVLRKKCILVCCKPGKVHLWCHSSSQLGWSGPRSYRLKTQKISVGSSALHPASGIQYISRQDILVLTLFDGSFHVIYNLSSEPTMIPQSDDIVVTSENLSQAVRSVFVQTENDVDFGDMNRITGLTSYDGSATFIWIQEASRPSDFSYKHDAKHNSTLLVSSLWNDSDDDSLVNELQEMLDEAKTSTSFPYLLYFLRFHFATAAGLAPPYLLRPFLFHLQDRTRLVNHYPRILEILKQQNDDHSLLVNVPTWTSMTPELRRIFRTSLMQHLFGWDTLFSLRMRLSIADFVSLLDHHFHTFDDPGSNMCRLQSQSFPPALNAQCTKGMSWQNYVDEQLIGSGKVTRAAIVGLQRGIWASSSGYTLSADDETALINAVNSPSSALSNGLRLRGQKFFIVQTNDRSLYGKKQADGIVVVKTTQAILVAEYDQPLQAAETTPVVEKLADYLISVGY